MHAKLISVKEIDLLLSVINICQIDDNVSNYAVNCLNNINLYHTSNIHLTNAGIVIITALLLFWVISAGKAHFSHAIKF